MIRQDSTFACQRSGRHVRWSLGRWSGAPC